MKTQRLLVRIYIIVVVIAAAAAFVASTKKNGIFACQAVADDGREFIAYCNASSYADFDHGAFYFGLRPETITAAANADVLFLGNSRLQFAYSTEALQRFFDARSLTYYLLGYSHGENQAFSRKILDLISPSASVYVIGVDDFFRICSDRSGPGMSSPIRKPGTGTRKRNDGRRCIRSYVDPGLICAATSIPTSGRSPMAIGDSRAGTFWNKFRPGLPLSRTSKVSMKKSWLPIYLLRKNSRATSRRRVLASFSPTHRIRPFHTIRHRNLPPG